MRIAVLASNFIRLPPDPAFMPNGRTGASEGIMYALVESLAKRGHDVTLFASGDSKTSARLVSVTTQGTAIDPDIGIGKHIDYEYALISQCYQQANQGVFDIIHSSYDVRSAFFAPFSSVPTVATLHSPLDGIRKDILKDIPKTQQYVSISNAQRRQLPHLRYVDTVYHGIDCSLYPLGKGEEGFFLSVGRIIQEKGVDHAVQVVLQTQCRLHIVGEPRDTDTYWIEKIQPYIDLLHITHDGFVHREKILKYYQQSTALLFPIQWEEPFGLVMIEAMACGTPVIAYNRGSVPEIVKDGVTGFIIDPDDVDRPGKGTWTIKKQGIAGLVEAMHRIEEIDRRACRKHVEDYFTLEQMVDGYERVYAKIVASKGTSF